LNVSFLRNENQFPDSGRSHVALQWAGPDPQQTQDILEKEHSQKIQ